MKRLLAIILAMAAILPITASSTRDDINNRLDKANELRHTDCPTAIKQLHSIFTEASANGLDEECARTFTYMGWALYNCHYYDLAIQVLKYVESNYQDVDSETRDLISLGLGAVYAANGEYAKGEHMLLKALEQSRQDGNTKEMMMIYTYLGDLYSNQAKEAKARSSFEKGRQIAHSLKDTVFEGALNCNIGTLCSSQEEAEQYLFRAIDLSQKISDKVTECYAYINLSELYYNNHDNVKALHTAEHVRSFFPYIDTNDKAISYVYSLLSSIYAAKGDYTAAYNQQLQATKQQQLDYNHNTNERAVYNAIVIDMIRQCELSRLNMQKREDINTFMMLTIIIVAVLLIAIIFFVLYRKSRAQHCQLLKQTNDIVTLEKTAKEQVTEISDTRHTMNYLYGFYRGRNMLLEKLSQMVKDGYKMNSTQLPSHLRIINHTITQSLTSEKEPEWVKRLESETDEFVERLTARYPDLSKTDIALAISYRLGLTTRDISRLSGKQPATITMARYRLRTSLNIPEDADLNEVFSRI